jgi:PRTRC genetic system ThiF family protein
MTHLIYEYLANPAHPISIDVVGCGGTGSQVLQGLARMNKALIGLGKPGIYTTAYDSDIVELPNIGRQLFSESDLGMSKSVVLVDRINRYFGFSWEAVNEKYEAKETSNIVITCIDTSKGRIEIGKHLRASKTKDPFNKCYYWLDFGNAKSTGQVVFGTIEKAVTNSKLPCVDEIFKLKNVKDVDSGPSCSLAEALYKQDLYINSTLANLGLSLLWKLLTTHMIEYHGCYLNLETLNVNPIKITEYAAN